MCLHSVLVFFVFVCLLTSVFCFYLPSPILYLSLSLFISVFISLFISSFLHFSLNSHLLLSHLVLFSCVSSCSLFIYHTQTCNLRELSYHCSCHSMSLIAWYVSPLEDALSTHNLAWNNGHVHTVLSLLWRIQVKHSALQSFWHFLTANRSRLKWSFGHPIKSANQDTPRAFISSPFSRS